MHPLMAQRGHRLLTPTYTGLGERAHLARPDIDLDTHIADVLGVIEMEDLNGFILIGHSYGGMVATGVAARARGRVKTLVYLDAFAPKDGDSIFSLTPDREKVVREQVAKDGDGWRITPNPMPPDTSAADQAWAMPRRLPQPFKTFEQRIKLPGGELDAAAALHLCDASSARRSLPAIPGARAARGLGRERDRRQPQSAHHLSGGADGFAGEDRGVSASCRPA